MYFVKIINYQLIKNKDGNYKQLGLSCWKINEFFKSFVLNGF